MSGNTAWRPNWRDARQYPVQRTEREWRWEFLRRDADYQGDFARNDPTRCREKYGVRFLWDPGEPKPALGLFATECPYGVTFADRRTFDKLHAEKIRLLAFDLRRPLKPQLAQAAEYLARLQAEIVGKPREQRNHRAKWARYLRVLDAKAAGAPALKIAYELRLQPRGDDSFDPARLVTETFQQAQAVQLRFSRHS